MSDVKAIAFFLPQFHPIPENDQWWGKGFTEWVGVTRARPSYPGHPQPRLPADLGFYDLRVPEVREEQAALARRYGIHGFCWYYYWFNGRRLLDRPFDEVLSSGRPDFPFCICWANENWTRRWDGAEHEVLVRQEHSPDSDRQFILDVLPILRDRRYIRIRGAPLLVVYRAAILPNALATTQLWRDVARRAGVGELHLAAVQSFGLGDPTPLGFDSAIEFPPHIALPRPLEGDTVGVDSRFSGQLYDYSELVHGALSVPRTEYRRFRGVMAAWDNTARRGTRAQIFHGATPEVYERWLREVAERTRSERDADERFVFVNAWNEWGEGTYLEPDQRHGHAWLEATARGLGVDVEPWRGNSLRWTGEIAADASFGPGQPPVRPPTGQPGRARTDRAHGATAGKRIELRHGERVALAGWAVVPGVEPARAEARSYLILASRFPRRTYHAPIRRVDRVDVERAATDAERPFAARAGFEGTVDVDAVRPGTYRLGVLTETSERTAIAFTGNRVAVVRADARRPRRVTPGRLDACPAVAPPPPAAVRAHVTTTGLRYCVDGDFSEPIAVGKGQVVRISGWCHHPRHPVESLEIVLDGCAHPVTHRHLARPDALAAITDEDSAPAVDSGFLALLPIATVERSTCVPVRLLARTSSGDTHEADLGTLRLVPRLDVELAKAPAAISPSSPLVAICMATYDPHLDLLEAQLDSIVRQTHGNWIGIINDDASPDAVFRGIQRLAARDARFQVFRNSRRLGFYRNFEACLARVPDGADFVALADQDDDWYPDKIATCLAAFAPDTELVYSDMELVTRDGCRISNTYWTTRRNNYTDLASLLFVNTVTGAASVFRASLLADALPFPPRIGNPYHDHWLACVALTKGKLGYVDRPLYAYRQHGRNVLGHHAPPAARLLPTARELISWMRSPAGLRKELRREVDRFARGFHDDVVRLAALARVLQMRGPPANPRKAQVLASIGTIDRSASRLVLEAVKYRVMRRPTSGAENYLLRALASFRILNGYHRFNSSRIGERARPIDMPGSIDGGP